MGVPPKQVGSLDLALREASSLLATQPSRAAEQAQAILRAFPGHPHAALILGISRRLVGNVDGALQIFEPLARAQAAWRLRPTNSA